MQVAEAVGFEPTERFPVRSVSNRVLSASQPRLRLSRFSRVRRKGQEGKPRRFDPKGRLLEDRSCCSPCLAATMRGLLSAAEQEMQHISVLHLVGFSFHPEFSCFLGARLTVSGDVVVIGDGL
jgi:hypothetical protein